MGGTGACCTRRKRSRVHQDELQERQCSFQGNATKEPLSQQRHLVTKHVSRQTPTAMRIFPTGGDENPMLNEHGKQFSVDLAENMVGLLGGPFMTVPMTFPEFEQELNLPSSPIEHEDVLGREQGSRDIGHKQVPGGESKRDSRRSLTFLFCSLSHML